MKLHELEENKTYIGEDGLEYKILDSHLCYLDGIGALVVTRLSTLTQGFTPNKDEPIVQWYDVLALRKLDSRPTKYHGPYKSEDDFLNTIGFANDNFDWIKLIPMCKTQGNKLVEE